MGSLQMRMQWMLEELGALLEPSEVFVWRGIAPPEPVLVPGLLTMSAADKGPAVNVGLLTKTMKTTTKEDVEQPSREGEEGATQGERIVPESVQHTYSLSVVLPAFNEAAVIEKTVSLVADALTQWTSDFEIVVVNDGSRDHTCEIVERMQAADAHIRLINHPVNKGYGAALITGFHAVSKELVFFMDSDGQFDINDLQSFFPLIEQYDAVFGYRNPRRDPRLRKLNAWGWKQLVRIVFGVQVRDIDCAFKLYRADFFQTLELETGGAMINAEILYKFKRAGLRYAEVGVRHLPREEGESTGARPAVIIRAIRELFVYARKWRQEDRL